MSTSEVEAPELKSCPFCGSKSVVWSENFRRVRCNGCYIGTPTVSTKQIPYSVETLQRIKAEAIIAWNTRSPSPSVDNDLAAHVLRVLLYASNFGDSVCLCGDDQPKGTHDDECEDAQRLWERCVSPLVAAVQPDTQKTTPLPDAIAEKCVKCGHSGWIVEGVCQWKPGQETAFEEICGCKCEFAIADIVAAVKLATQPASAGRGDTNAGAERVVQHDPDARQIVGTVFDNTAASHETLKQVMIERIESAIAATKRAMIQRVKELWGGDEVCSTFALEHLISELEKE